MFGWRENAGIGVGKQRDFPGGEKKGKTCGVESALLLMKHCRVYGQKDDWWWTLVAVVCSVHGFLLHKKTQRI